jgi:hypothetical protein
MLGAWLSDATDAEPTLCGRSLLLPLGNCVEPRPPSAPRLGCGLCRGVDPGTPLALMISPDCEPLAECQSELSADCAEAEIVRACLGASASLQPRPASGGMTPSLVTDCIAEGSVCALQRFAAFTAHGKRMQPSSWVAGTDQQGRT